jgi:hypothetical protein
MHKEFIYTEKEQLILLSEVLNNLLQSIDNYIEDGILNKDLTADIDHSWVLLKQFKLAGLK